MFNGVMCDSGHPLRSQCVRTSCRSPGVCLDDFSQSKRGPYPYNMLAETFVMKDFRVLTYLRHMASKFPASVRQLFPYCITDKTKSACIESREGEFSAVSMTVSFKLFLRNLASSDTRSWRLADSNVAAVMA